jgi:hypothetical protein
LSLDRFELLELRRDGGIQTYHAREISTARPVQVHLFAAGLTAENLVLFRRIDRLPDTERRRVLDRGDSRGTPYVVTDRLAGYTDFREWVTANAVAVPNPSIDEQFLQLFEPLPGPPAPLTLTRGLEKPEQPLEDEVENATRKPQNILPVAAKSLAGLVLGVLTALLVLAMVVAYFAFRPI